MNVLKKSMLVGGCVAALTLFGGSNLMAQGRGNFDPAQFRQDRLDRYREQLEVKDEGDWKALEPLVGKVLDDEIDMGRSRMRGMFGGGGNRRNRGGNSDSTNSTSSDSNRQRQRGGGFGEPSAAVTALQKAIDDKAPASEIKAKLAAARAETKEKEAKLASDQEELRGVLTSRQEAIAVVNGLLK
jgi:hypothetical protein